MGTIVLAIIALWLLTKLPDFGGLATDVVLLLVFALLSLFVIIRLIALTGC